MFHATLKFSGLKQKKVNYDVLSEDDTKHYYKIGNKEIVKQYYKIGIIDQNQQSSLLTWVQADSHLDRNTPEYRECLDVLKGNV